MAKSTVKKLNASFNINGWGFVSAALLLIAIFSLYPIFKSLWLSTQVGIGVVTKFGGLANLERLLADQLFMTALKNTILFFVIQVPIMIILAIAAANALNNPNLKFRGFFRTAIFLPAVTSLVAYSMLFRSMFATDGVINVFLLAINLINEPIEWLTDPFWAKVTIILAITWRWTGYNMIFCLAAMQNIDRSVYEAADLDGASSLQKFFRITVPMLKPVILFISITSTIGTLQLFDEVMNITQGGPANSTLTLSMYIYNLSFRFVPNFGYAATVSYVVVLMVAILSLIQLRAGGRES